MIRITKILPAFDAQNAFHSGGIPQNFELADNVPPGLPGVPDTAPELALGDHGRLQEMPVSAQNGDHGRPDIQPALPVEHPAESQENVHVNLDVPDSTTTGEAGSPQVRTESFSRADIDDPVGGDHPNADMPDQATVDDPMDAANDHVPDDPEEDEHGEEPVHLPDQAANDTYIADHAQGEPDVKTSVDCQTDVDLADVVESHGPETGNIETPEAASAIVADLLGFPTVFVAEVPPQFQDDPDADVYVDFFF